MSTHGDKDQEERNKAVQEFRAFRKDVLVATDVASKGLFVLFLLKLFEYASQILFLISKYLFEPSRLSVLPSLCASVQRLTPIPAGKSINVTNKSCCICLRGDKNALRVIS